jgi:hypothetical protein
MTAAADAPAQEMGLFARVVGVITSPKATFESVVAKPRPAGVLLLAALVIGIAAGSPQFTVAGRQAAIDSQVQTNERMLGRPLTEAEFGRIERFAPYGPYFAIGGTLVFMPVMSLIIAGLLWVVFNTVLGGTAAFKQVLAIQTHSAVITALGTAIGAPIQLMQGKMTAGGPFNLGALVPMLDENSTLATLLGATSVFAIWGLIVTAIGLAVLYRRKALNISIGLIVTYTLIAFTVISTLGSLFGGGQGR